MKKYAIKVENINKHYRNGKRIKKKVFDDFSIEFESKKIHCLLGVSGCGKSTLLRTMAGLEEVESGTITYEKSDKKLPLSMILQDNNLLPWMTIKENIQMALDAQEMKMTDEELDEILKRHNLLEYKNFHPYELSVGLKQKVALCKAIITKPNIILLDEPFCALDFISKENIHDIFLKEFRKEKFTAIFSTHYIEEAVKLGDYIHLLSRNNEYKMIKNPLKKPREKDKNYNDFLKFIKKEYV